VFLTLLQSLREGFLSQEAIATACLNAIYSVSKNIYVHDIPAISLLKGSFRVPLSG
jgi:hypothetical protein